MNPSRTWNLWAYASRSTFWHIGAKRWVELHGLSDPIVPVLVEECTGDVLGSEVTHYGWEYTEKPGSVTMIWPRATNNDRLKPWMSLEMCFAYGMQAEVDAGKGNMVALRITRREHVE